MSILYVHLAFKTYCYYREKVKINTNGKFLYGRYEFVVTIQMFNCSMLNMF